jgi:hypothetical protein
MSLSIESAARTSGQDLLVPNPKLWMREQFLDDCASQSR